MGKELKAWHRYISIALALVIFFINSEFAKSFLISSFAFHIYIYLLDFSFKFKDGKIQGSSLVASIFRMLVPALVIVIAFLKFQSSFLAILLAFIIYQALLWRYLLSKRQ